VRQAGVERQKLQRAFDAIPKNVGCGIRSGVVERVDFSEDRFYFEPERFDLLGDPLPSARPSGALGIASPNG